MTRRLGLALAALVCLLALPAAAQSSVTVYGLIDTAMGKYDGPPKTSIMTTGATSRLGFRGIEDLGGGLKAIFQLEHQFNPDDGTNYNPTIYFSGRSTVGLEGFFGRVTLGREVNASHYVEAGADPFGQDGLPAGYGARGGISQANGGPGQIDTVRTNNSVNYAYTLGGFTFRACTMPGSLTSTAHFREPSTLAGMSKRAGDCPTILRSCTGLTLATPVVASSQRASAPMIAAW